MIGEISISAKEARNFFENNAFFYQILRFISEKYGRSDYSLRLFPIGLHLINLALIFGISLRYLRKKSDALFCTIAFGLIPGVNFLALFANEGILVLTISLVFALLFSFFQNNTKISLIARLILIAAIASLGFEYLLILLGLLAYLLRQKRFYEALFCVICMGLNLYFFDSQINGRPRAYFFDTLSQMSIIYSPILFIYYAYSLYWGIVVRNHILAYLGASSIIFCLVLSIRQSIDFYTFLPQSLVGFPIMIMCFFSDLRTKLIYFRKKNYVIFTLILAFLLIELAFIFGNKITYTASAKPNFASSYYFSKEIANNLKKLGISSIKSPPNLRYQLKFYGIEEAKSPRLIPTYGAQKSDIKIIYNNRLIRSYDIKG